MKRILTAIAWWLPIALVIALIECLTLAYRQWDLILCPSATGFFTLVASFIGAPAWFDPGQFLLVPTAANLLRFAAYSVAAYGAVAIVAAIGSGLVLAIGTRFVPALDRLSGAVHGALAFVLFGIATFSIRLDLLADHYTTAARSMSGVVPWIGSLFIVAAGFLLYRWLGRHPVPARAALVALAAIVWCAGAGFTLFDRVLGDDSGGGGDVPELAAGTTAGGLGRSVVLISIDTLRADHLGAYGYPRPTSPALDRLADGGVLFERCASASSWTLPGHLSLLTSTYAGTHGGTSQETQPAAWPPLLSQAYRARGYRTYGVVANPNVSKIYGFDRGFEQFYDGLDGEPWTKRTAQVIIDRAISLLEQGTADSPDEPFFLFLHFYDPHTPYEPEEPYRSMFVENEIGADPATSTRTPALIPHAELDVEMKPDHLDWLVSLYDAEIRYVDDHLERFFRALDRLGLRDSTIISVVSDHGEEFKEHQSLIHGNTMYEEMIRIPWILHVPGGPSGVRVAETVRAIDVAPTLLELSGQPPLPSFEGSSMAAAIELGRAPEVAAFSETTNFLQRKAVIKNDYKLIISPYEERAELYDLRLDPAEQNNLAATEPERLEELKRELYGWLDSQQAVGRGKAILSEEAEAELRALGYL